MAKKKSLFQEFTKGILVENPVLRLVLGTCPTLDLGRECSGHGRCGFDSPCVL